MNRRTLLEAAGITLLPVLSGCSINTEKGENPENQNTPVESNEATPTEDERELVNAGTPIIRVELKVTGDYPDDVTPISSSDERIADVTLFSGLFSKVEEAARQQTEEELLGDLFRVRADRETENGREAKNAMEKLPLMKETLETSGSESTVEGIYITHDGHTCFMFFRLYHLD